jgi:predicted acyltransferase
MTAAASSAPSAGFVAPALPAQGERLLSLDCFRGITIAGMVLVNNPGSWSHMYAPLGHAQWHGCTPTDLIFPFFLFMVGVAMTYSFDKRLAAGYSKLRLFEGVVKRALMLFFLGLILGGYPNFRLIMPYILGLFALGFLFADEPPFGKPQSPTGWRNKAIAGVFGLAGILWFALDFRYFNTPLPSDALWFMREKTLRIPGVLQRIALCYLLASSIVFFAQSWKSRVAWFTALITVYWLILGLVKPPASYVTTGKLDAPEGASYPGHLIDWLDQLVLGNHLYPFRPDPEGLLSTIPAVASVLGGVLCGMWLKSSRSQAEKATGMLALGALLIFLGLCIDAYFPLNKKIWSSSYVVYCTGMGALCLGLCYWSIDYLGFKRWAWPFIVFGTNAILIFFGSGIMVRTFFLFCWERDAEGAIVWSSFAWNNMFPRDGVKFVSLKDVFHEVLFLNPFRGVFGDSTWFAVEKNASLAYALSFVLLWLVLAIPLYHKKIFLKV